MNDGMQHAAKKMAALEAWLAPLFHKTPHLPQDARKALVSIAPWLALVFGALGVFGILTGGMLLSLLSFGFGISYLSMAFGLLASLAASVLQLMAFQPLKEHKKKGWDFLFYGTVLMIIATVLDALLSYGYGLFGNLLMSVIGLWLLFEVREMYR